MFNKLQDSSRFCVHHKTYTTDFIETLLPKLSLSEHNELQFCGCWCGADMMTVPFSTLE